MELSYEELVLIHQAINTRRDALANRQHQLGYSAEREMEMANFAALRNRIIGAKLQRMT